jgi:hypothetical protein
MSVVVEEFRPILKNTLRGFARVRFQSGLVMHDVALHISCGQVWASPPSKPMVDSSGRVLRDAEGKTRWQPLITFSNRNIRQNWSAQIVAAVDGAYPSALREAIPERSA